MNWQHSYHRTISGEATGLGPRRLHAAALALAEPIYATAVRRGTADLTGIPGKGGGCPAR